MVLLISTAGRGQVTKNHWLVGGTIDYKYNDYGTATTGVGKSYNFNLSGRLGYFFADRLAAGILPSIQKGKFIATAPTYSQTIGGGPFIRYYFLPFENRFNLLIEPYFLRSVHLPNKQEEYKVKLNTFGVMAGPVLFVNSVVGFEFLLGYSSAKSPGSPGSNKGVFIGLGIQVHLERESDSTH
jgi:hypothetical protein